MKAPQVSSPSRNIVSAPVGWKPACPAACRAAPVSTKTSRAAGAQRRNATPLGMSVAPIGVLRATPVLLVGMTVPSVLATEHRRHHVLVRWIDQARRTAAVAGEVSVQPYL